MRIGFDGKRAARNFTGLGNYSRYLLEAMVKCYPDEEYMVYTPKDSTNEKFEKIISLASGRIRKVLPPTALNRRMRSLWRVWGIEKELRRDGIQLFHGLSNELPLTIKSLSPHVKSVVTIHDLIFLKFPQCYPFIDRVIYDYKFRKACINADHIIAVSECTKRDIVSYYGIAPEKISVIYQGCDSLFASVASDEKKEEIRKKHALPDKFILSVGTIEKRKNLLSVVKALPLLPDDVHVVAVGRRTEYTDLIDEFVEEHNLRHRVHLLHGVPFADLPVIYQCADVFAYVSIYEGFGIPILEALNARIPVVAAIGSCLEEAGGAGSKYVTPYNVEAIAKAVKECYDPEIRASMIEQGLQWAQRFTPENFARQTMECYRKLLAR